MCSRFAWSYHSFPDYVVLFSEKSLLRTHTVERYTPVGEIPVPAMDAEINFFKKHLNMLNRLNSELPIKGREFRF